LFTLSRLRAETKTKRALIGQLLYADDAVLVAHSEMYLQILCERFANACTDFSMTINLKKTVVMLIGTLNPPRILINGSLRDVVDKFWDLLSTLRTIWTTKSTNELERLQATQFSGLDQSPPRYQIRVCSECSAIRQRDVVHIPPPRKPA